jgi:hypothetical protein
MSSQNKLDEVLYQEIIKFVSGKPHNLKVGSTDLIKAEIADRYVLKFPDLGLEENRDALEYLLELKYDEIESAILHEREIVAELNYLEQKDRLRTLGKLERLGVLPANDGLFFLSDQAGTPD